MFKRDTVLMFFVVITALLVIAMQAQDSLSDDVQRTITVTAEGEYHHIADGVHMSVFSRHQNILLDNIVQVIANEYNDIITLDDSYADISNAETLTYPVYANDGSVLVTNLTFNRQITIHDLSQYNQFVTKFSELGITLQANNHFFVHNDELMMHEAEIDALTQARASAVNIAQAEGLSIGDIISVETDYQGQLDYQAALNPAIPYENIDGYADLEGQIFLPPVIHASVTTTVTYELR